jgi:hypothetical protein
MTQPHSKEAGPWQSDFAGNSFLKSYIFTRKFAGVDMSRQPDSSKQFLAGRPSAVVPASRGPRSLAGPSRADLAKVHIAKRDLKLSDQLYRGFLDVLFGETSAKNLSHGQTNELLDHFKSLGWQSGFGSAKTGTHKTKGSGRSKKPARISSGRSPATMAQLSLIVYFWKHGPGIRHKSLEALDHFLNHHFHIAHLREVKAGQVPGIVGAIRRMVRI